MKFFKDWAGNRKEDYDYLKYLVDHKYNVYKGGRELGGDRWDLIKHDWSKFHPALWVPYREKWFGDNPNEKAFRRAAKRHVEMESHHDYKYFPDKNLSPNAENYADWWSVAKSKDPNIPGIKEWLRQKNINPPY
jgi:hypothetical protein